jgi:integrase
MTWWRATVAKLDLEYVNSFIDRHGHKRHYFRKGGKRYPIPGAPGTAVFAEAYDKLLTEHAPHLVLRQGRAVSAAEGTLGWVILQYKKSDLWKVLQTSTQEVYNRRFDWLVEHYGTGDIATLTERHVRIIRNELKDRTTVADAMVDKIGMLWAFAKEHLEMDDLGPNPSKEVASLHKASTPHPKWPEELCQRFEQLDSPRMVRAYYLLRYTGQRRSDVVKMQPKQFDGSAIEVVQQKTGSYCWIPCHQNLRDHLAATGIDQPYLLTSSAGDRYQATSLTNLMIIECKNLGFPGFSPHGLRHLAGAALAEAGCTVDEIMSILGHKTEGEARVYVQQANRKIMASSGILKWERKSNGSGNPTS